MVESWTSTFSGPYAVLTRQPTQAGRHVTWIAHRQKLVQSMPTLTSRLRGACCSFLLAVLSQRFADRHHFEDNKNRSKMSFFLLNHLNLHREKLAASFWIRLFRVWGSFPLLQALPFLRPVFLPALLKFLLSFPTLMSHSYVVCLYHCMRLVRAGTRLDSLPLDQPPILSVKELRPRSCPLSPL